MTQRRPLWPLLAAVLVAGSAPAQEGAPLSAIDWLSRSVDEAEAAAVARSEPEVATSAASPQVTVQPLDDASPDAVGVLGPSVTGFPVTLWSASAASDLTALLADLPPPRHAAPRALLRTLLLAEGAPPVGADAGGAFFLARVDKLLEIGDLDAAQALLEAADLNQPAIFRRWFDVALLTGTEDAPCAVLREQPSIAPTYPARIFCLARNGQWDVAALTLNTHRVLGDVTEEEEVLLSRFLDPDLFEEDGPLGQPERVSPLVFRMREAIGEGLNTSGLPLAFAHADLRDTVGWKPQLDAAERLTRAGVLEPQRLQALYTSRTPSASGGVWDRVDAMQRFEVALRAGDPGAVSRNLPPAWDAAHAIRFEVGFSELYADAVARLPLSGAAADIAQRMGLLASRYEETGRALSDQQPLWSAIATGEARGIAVADLSVQERAVLDGFFTGTPPQDLQNLAAQGRLGEALLLGLQRLNAGIEGNTSKFSEALAFLRHVGLEDIARRTALQILLLERAA